MIEKTQVYLGLGGNEGQVLDRLQQALFLLSHQENVEGLQVSHFYHTAPLDVESPLWFVNAVCSFQTTFTPQEVFKLTQTIECRLGKVVKPKTAARPIDIDLLFYGHHIYQDSNLDIPHPKWKERLFVLIPLMDLTKAITLQKSDGKTCYLLQDLVQPLWSQSDQSISLLEKNLDFQ